MDLPRALSQMLDKDNQRRLEAEIFYAQCLAGSPDQLILAMMQVFQVSSTAIKNLIAVLLTHLVDPLSGKEIWGKVNSQTQNQFKASLLHTLSTESHQKTSELLCDLAGKLAVSIFTAKDTWPEIVEFVKIGLSSETVHSSLDMLGKIYVYAWKEIPVDSKIFEKFLQGNDIRTKFSAIKALNSLFAIMKSRKAMSYCDLVPTLLIGTYSILSENEYFGGKTVEFLIEISEHKGFLFANHLALCYDFFSSSAKLLISTSTKLLLAEFIVSLYENISDLESDIGKVLLTDIFQIMVNSESASDDWQTSPDESEIEIDYSILGRKLINRLVEAVGETILLDPVLLLIHGGLSNQDWRSQYSALLTLGELIPLIAEPSKISEIIPIVTSACSSLNCKVKYAGFTLISDLSTGYIQEFQASYHNIVFPVILTGIHEQVIRVKAQALIALTSFIEGSGNKISCMYSECLGFLFSLLYGQADIVVEHAITAISAFAKTMKTKFTDFYQDTVDHILPIIKKYGGNHGEIRGRAVECVSLASASVGKQMFSTKIQAIVQAITSFEVANEHEIMSYLLSSWQNICDLLQEDFSEYLDHIVPQLLKLITSQNEGVNVNTTEVINKELALQTLSKFVEVLKGKYGKYLDETLRATLPFVNYTLNDSLRATAAEVLAGLVQAKKSLPEPLALTHSQELAKVFLSLLLNAIREEFHKEALISQLAGISKILEVVNAPFLAQAEVNEIGSFAIQMLVNKAKTGFNSDDSEVYIGLTEVIGSIFKTHPYFTSPLLGAVSSEIIPKLVVESQSNELHKYALFIIDDAIEYLSASHSTDKWDEIISILLCYANDPDDALRQAAVYGLGLYAQSSQNFADKAPVVLSALFCSLEIPLKRIKTYGHARDNSISAIGKVIKFQSNYIDLQGIIEKWISLLPLKWDKGEANFAHELLADLLEWKYEFVVNGQETFVKVLEIVAYVAQTKLVNEKTTEKFKGFLGKYYRETQEVWGRLTEVQQEKIRLLGFTT